MTQGSFNVEELNDLIQNACKFIINNSVTKLPIKRSDIVAQCFNGNNKVFSRAFDCAKTYLYEIYGVTVVDVPDVSQKVYITTSSFSAASLLEYTEEQRKDLTFLFLILSYIFMKGGTIQEETLFTFLRRLGIEIDIAHSYFGDNLKKLITETYTKQLYLKREKMNIESSREDGYQLSWGFRSTLEFPKKDVLDQVAKIIGKPSICFVPQHREVHGDGDYGDSETLITQE